MPAASSQPPLSTPAIAASIIASLADPSTSLHDIAARHHTTLEQLTLFITRPDIAERLENLHAAAASRARLLATSLLDKAINTLVQVMDQAAAPAAVARAYQPVSSTPESQHTPPSPSPNPQSEIPNPQFRHRLLESARRAASRLISIANYHPIPLFTKPAAQTAAVARAYQPVSSATANAPSRPQNSAAATPPNPLPTSRPTVHEASPATRASAQDSLITQLASPVPEAPAAPRPLQRPCSLLAQPFTAGTTPHNSKPHRSKSPPGRFNGLPSPAASAMTLLARAGNSTFLLTSPHEHWP